MSLTSFLTNEVTLYCFRKTECNPHSCVYVRRKVLRFNETYRKRPEQKLRANWIVLTLHDIHQYFYVTDTPYDTDFSTHDPHCFSKFCNREKRQVDPYRCQTGWTQKEIVRNWKDKDWFFKTYQNGRIEDVVRSFVVNLFLSFISVNK